ncbi:hypothetical protein Bca52824_013629 [Brassica carinata]|uniref:SBP-type domain-containing protein n=1 Tax=Brassica carinata TaxID=52824 RepID=A0A8X7VZA1_BRACI|nr:hypothetical protein Bca52824_013629 [Brassica carinata]
MLDYEWDNPSVIMLSGEDRSHHHQQEPDPTRVLSIFDPTLPIIISPLTITYLHLYFLHSLTNNIWPSTVIRPTTTTTSFIPPLSMTHAPPLTPPHPIQSTIPTTQPCSPSTRQRQEDPDLLRTTSSFPRPKSTIGLNLGGRTYFSAADNDFVSRLYRRSRPGELGMGNTLSIPRCQAEGCSADLSHAKHYHRRHKVCEFHSKASTVVAAGLSQRFCQQCSRFHLLSEFDNGKRSCRKRLADHNRRRRKCHQSTSKPTPDITTTPQSPNDSGVKSLSSPSNALPTISLDCFRRKQFQTTTPSSSTSASSSNSMFFSSG